MEPEITEEQKAKNEITNKYFQACAQLGDLDIKSMAIDEQKEKVRLEIFNLNQKYKKFAEKTPKAGGTDGISDQQTTN